MITYKTLKNHEGPELGYCSVKLIEKDGCYFKDLEGTGELVPYEDWRLSPEERAADLASRLSIEEIAGLMMYSPHQLVPARSEGWFTGTYSGGKRFEDSEAEEWDLTDQQRKFLTEDHVRYVLAMELKNGRVAAKWNNEMQALCENMPHGIPVNISSDPRHGAGSSSTEFKTEAKDTSKWPTGLGILGATPENAAQTHRIGGFLSKKRSFI